jgi:hypothetical protein
MLLHSFLPKANVNSATRTPIPNELLNNWQKCIGKKGATRKKSLPSPSPIDDSDSDFPPLGGIIPLIKYTTRSSLAALPGGDANNVAGPSTIRQSQSNGTDETQETSSNSHHLHGAPGAVVIEIEGNSFHCSSMKLLRNFKFQIQIRFLPLDNVAQHPQPWARLITSTLLSLGLFMWMNL